jgi:peptide/nickel transport system substrate-binding protein
MEQNKINRCETMPENVTKWEGCMELKRLLTISIAAIGISFAANAADLRVGLQSEPSSIDPHYHNLGPNNGFATHIFGTLVGSDENQQHYPDLAVSWKPIDNTTWEFKLRKGVKWHDGSPFSADDVIFTVERAQNVPNSPSSFVTYLKGKTFSKIDDHTIHIKTASPYPLMPNDMTTVKIISANAGKGASTEDYNSGKAAIGTGPYKFVEWVPGDRIVLQRNDDYYGTKANFDKVTFKPIKSGPARISALLAGDVDFIDNVPPLDVARLKQDKSVQLSSGPSNRVIYLHMDQYREASPHITAKDGGPIKNPLMDVRVRKAISLSINRDAIVDRVMEGVAVPAGQLLPAGFHGVSSKMKPDPYDPKMAKKLMAEAGYENGFKMVVHGPNDRYINDAKIAEALAQMLNRVGIEASVETMTKAVYFKRASRGGPDNSPEFSFMVLGWGAGSGEASSPLKALLHSYDKSKGMGAANRGRHSDAEVDSLVQKALATVDADERGKLLAAATEKAVGENYGVIPLHYQVNTWAAKSGYKYLPRTDERTIIMGLSAN